MTLFQNTPRIHGRILWHIPITTDGFIFNTGHCRRRYTRFTQLCICPWNPLKVHGCVLWPKPVTTDDFIINTGHCRRLYTRFTLLCETPQNAPKIHGRVLWHKPITTDDFIINTGHCRRLYTRFTLLCETPQNALKYTVVYYDINRSRPMALYSSHTIIGAPVDRSRYLVQHARPCFVHRPDSSSVFT